jgi:hypothetical protein
MINIRLSQDGFSAAELLITLFIGTVFLIAGAQLYTAVSDQTSNSNRKAQLSSASLTYLNLFVNNKETRPTTCGSLPENYSADWPFSETGDIIHYDFTIACPDSINLPNLRSFTVKASRNGVSATHATYYDES